MERHLVFKSFIRSLKPVVRQLQPTDPSFIDVKRLIAELSDEQLMRSADEYFSTMTLASEQCRKPFSNPSDSIYLTRHLGLLLEAADLFRGARVLEVGCGTGWLSIALAQMGCEAIGVDISPAALRLADGLKAARGVGQPGLVEFKAYDGQTLPLPDASVDRIVCFDAFHHVRDQGATLKEFARVLRNGGRAAFLEPGPNHSKTPMSQAEMANHQVIENDVSMEEVTRHALDAGLDRPQMLVQFQQPMALGVDEFNAWARGGIPRERGARLLDTLQAQITNGQCFFIYKGQPTRDSRRADGLAATLELVSARRVPTATGVGLRLEVRVRNTGSREWIAAAVPGQVNLGVHVLSPAGELVDNNFARLTLPTGPVVPGAEVLIRGVVREPTLAGYRLRLDMVAELVAWFGDLGESRPLVVDAPAA
jgi:SAM-dependent methyltransferase